MSCRFPISMILCLAAGCGTRAAHAPDMAASAPDMAANAPDMAVTDYDMATVDLSARLGVGYCDPDGGAALPGCSFPTGLVLGGDFEGVVSNYDECPAFVSAGDALSTIDGNGAVHEIVPQGLYQVAVGPTALFAWSGGAVGTLAFWSRDRGTVTLSTNSSPTFGFSASASYVSFTTNDVPESSLVTLKVDALDCRGAAGAITLDQNVSINTAMTGGRLVAASFNQGFVTGTLRSYDPATGNAITLQDPAVSGAVAAAGRVLLVGADPYPLSVVSAGGGKPTPISSSSGSVGSFTHDGSAVFYVDQQKLMRAPVDGSAATVVVSPINTDSPPIAALSPDDHWLAYTKQQAGSAGLYRTDGWVVSALGGQSSTALATAETIAPNSIGFTADSKWIYWIDSDVLHARSLTTNAPDLTLGNAFAVKAGSGAHLVWQDSSTTLYTVDLASGNTTPRAIATLSSRFGGPNPLRQWVLSNSGTTVFYVLPSSGGVAGVYAERL